MNFKLTDEQKFIQDTIRKFLARECPREMARALDDRQVFPEELLSQIAALGFCGLNTPEEFGGGGKNLLGSILVIEELATICPTLASAFASVALRGGWTISELGSEEQRRRWLPGIAQGIHLFTYAITEPGTDATLSDIRTTAIREGGDFVLNGTKMFVGLAKQANFLLTLARTDGEAGLGGSPVRSTNLSRPVKSATEACSERSESVAATSLFSDRLSLKEGLSFFSVDATTPGLRLTEIDKVGYRGASLCQVVFDHVRVSRDDILGGVDSLNRGCEQAQAILALEHLETAAYGLGIAQGAYSYAAHYARERVQFGQPIAQFEAIQHMLVDIAVEIRATRLLLYQACWLAEQSMPFALEAAMARVRATEMARQTALQGLHILGGYGYSMEYDAQRYVRDSLVLLTGSETVELVKSSVGEMLRL